MTDKDTSLGNYELKEPIFQHFDPNGNPFGAPFGSRYAKHNVSWKRGQSIPNFYQRRARGELLPYTSFQKFISNGERSGYAKIRNSAGWSTEDKLATYTSDAYVLSYDQIVDAYTPISPESYLQAAAGQIYERGFDALTFFAELPETIKMFADVVKKIRNFKAKAFKYARQLAKRQTIRTASEIERLVSDLWLEARYGWRTLGYDIRDFDEMLQADWSRKRFTERVGTTYLSSEETYLTHVGYGGTSTIRRLIQLSQGIRGSVCADFTPSKLRFNPFITGWEVVPYSFVVDWVVGIGDALSAASFLATVDAYTGSYGWVCDVDITEELVGHSFDTGNSGPLSMSMSQQIHWEIRLPSRVPIRPFVRLNFNAAKAADLAAMAKQLVLR